MTRSVAIGPDEERALAVDFIARRPSALAAVYDQHGGVLYGIARRVLGGEAEAQDCVHDALLRVWTRPDSYRAERGALVAFLASCVRNEALSRRRSAARRFELDVRHANEQPATEGFDIGDPLERARLQHALATLPSEQRVALELAYFQYRTHVEIAAELNVPLGTIKSRISLALRRLGTALRAPERTP